MFGDWGTSRLYVLGLAFLVAGRSSFWLVAAMSLLILSVGWAHEGYSARDIDLDHIGVGWILAEGGLPRRFKAAYLTDDEIELILDILRRRHTA